MVSTVTFLNRSEDDQGEKRKMARFIFSIWLTSLLVYRCESVISIEDHRSLHSTLMAESYDPLLRPANDTSRPVKVGLRFTPTIAILNEVSQELELRGMLKMSWEDFRLQWDPSNHNGINITDIPIKRQDDTKIWIPELVLNESLETNFRSFQPESYMARVDSSGLIQWFTWASTKSFCLVDVSNYPFDRQTCVLTFTTWVHQTDKQIFIAIDDIIVNQTYKDYQVNQGVWDATILDVEVDTMAYGCQGCFKEEQSYLRYKIALKRKNRANYFFNLILPCYVMSAMTMLIMFLPQGNDSDTATFGLTCILTLIVFLTFLFTILPSTGQPLLGHYVVWLTVEGVLITLYAVCDAHHETSGKTPGIPLSRRPKGDQKTINEMEGETELGVCLSVAPSADTGAKKASEKEKSEGSSQSSGTKDFVGACNCLEVAKEEKKRKMPRFVCSIMLTSLLLYRSDCANTTVVTMLYRELLNYTKYEPAVRPMNDADLPLVVEYAFVPILHNLSWVDDRLGWDPEDYEGVNRLQIPVAEIWTPDLTVYEGISTNSDESFQTETKVATTSYTGEVQWDTMATSRSFCLMDVTYFPYDEHKCYLTFTSLAYLKTEVQLKQNKAILGNHTYKDYEVHSAEWEMSFTENDPGKSDYVECGYCLHHLSNISYIVSLRRLNPINAYFTFVFPCFLMASVSSCIECFPGGSEEAPSFGLACSLALTVFLMALYNMLPGTGFCKLGLLIVYLLYVVALETGLAATYLSSSRRGIKKRGRKSENNFREGDAEQTALREFPQTEQDSSGQTQQRTSDMSLNPTQETNNTVLTRCTFYLSRRYFKLCLKLLALLKMILFLHFFIVVAIGE